MRVVARVATMLMLTSWLGVNMPALGAEPAAKAAATGTPSGACHASAALAASRRTPVAAYYDTKLALVSGTVYEWAGSAAPRAVLHGAVQVAVADARAYALDTERRVIGWQSGSDATEVLLDDTVWIAAGASGLLVIRCDGSLWQRPAATGAWSQVADNAVHAWVGDGADYYVQPDGGLFVRGQARRGQYGDGRLTEGAGWTRVADDAVAVVAHTGHALYLNREGKVLGTGGNRFGPLGAHGFGDKADSWGVLFGNALQIATGSRHSLALRADGSLWVWGDGVGLLPRKLLGQVVAASGGNGDSVALTSDGAVWQWKTGRAPQRLVLPLR